MADGPINYAGMLTQPDFEPLMQGLQIRKANKAMEFQQDQIMQKQAAQQAEQTSINQDLRVLREQPTPENYANFTLRHPQLHEAATAAWSTYAPERQNMNLRDMTGAFVALKNGQPQYAKDVLTQRRAILEKNGESTAETDQALKLIEDGHADTAQDLLFYGMSAAAGADKFGSMVGALGGNERADEVQPGVVRKGNAEATTAEAQAAEAPAQQAAATRTAMAGASTAETTAAYAPQVAEVGIKKSLADIANIDSTINERSERLGLDRDKLTSDVQIKLEEMNIDRTKLSDGAATQLGKYVADAEGARGVAARAGDLATQFDKSNGASGAFASFGDWIGTNGQEAVRLRREYAAIMGSQVVKNLPPGSASDTDIALATKGYPPNNARPSTIASFLRGMEKLQNMSANMDQSKADWLAGNGNLGTLQRDVVVNGVRVAKGTSYGDFSKTVAARSRKADAEDTSGRSYMRYGR
jgi:hypothetical protein